MGRLTKWGILGAGTMARHFAEDLKFCDNGIFHGIASRSPDKTIAIAKEHNAKAFNDINVLFTDPEIDIIYIATPNSLHFEHCKRALSAGKAVLCEKPFALSAKEAKIIQKLAEDKGLFCMEAMWSRFLPIMETIKDHVERGTLGHIHGFRAELGLPVSYAENTRFSNLDLGGGALLDLGVYGVSLAHFLLGNPARVFASASLTPRGVDEHCSILMAYDNLQAQIVASHACELPNKLIISGEKGRIELQDLFIQGNEARLYRYERHIIDADTNTNDQNSDFKQKLKSSIIGRMLKKVINRLRPAKAGEVISSRYPGHGSAGDALTQNALATAIMPMSETVEVMTIIDKAFAEIHHRNQALRAA